MSISYKHLLDTIEDYDLSFTIVCEESGISTDTLTRIKKDKYVSLYSLEKIAEYLSKKVGKKLQPSDLFEFIY